MTPSIQDAISLFEGERDAIWLNAPPEILVLAKGESPRGIGSRGQYLTPILFAEGAARTLADETLWGILRLCDTPNVDLYSLKAMIRELVGRKAGFFELFGLEHVASLIRLFVDATECAQSTEELKELTAAMSSYVNRVQVWIDAAFPWGLCNGYMRAAYGSRNAEGAES